MAQAELETDRLAAGQLAQLSDELQHLCRRGEGAVARGRDAVLTHRYAAGVGDFLGDLVLGQDAAMARFGALAELDLDHLHLRAGGLGGETLGIEATVRGTATEVAAAQLPDQITAVLAVVGADAAFTSVVVELAEFRPFVERANGVGTERAEAHRRDVEQGRRVRLAALWPADLHAKAARVGQRRRAHRVADELETVLVHIAQCAEGFVGALVLGARIHQRALGAGEGQLLGVTFEQVLANLWADTFDQVADVAQDRVVAPHCMARLQQVTDTDQAEHAGEQGKRPQPLMTKERQAGQGEQHAEGEKSVAAEQGEVHASSRCADQDKTLDQTAILGHVLST